MHFEWDPAKNALNIRKHGIPFELGVQILDGPTLVRYDGREDYGEERWVAIGHVGARTLTVAYTERGEIIRIISARRATKYERQDYEAYLCGR